MADSSAKKPDLPDIASVLRAIHDDPILTRDDLKSQNELLRKLVEKKHRRLPEDGLKETTKRLRTKLMSHYRNYAKYTIKRTKGSGRSARIVWEQEPFSKLFFCGLNLFSREHLDNLKIDWYSDDGGDDNDDEDEAKSRDGAEGGDEEEHIEKVMVEDQSQRNASSPNQTNEQSSSHGTAIEGELSKKRKANDSDSDSGIRMSQAPRSKRLQVEDASTSGDTEFSNIQSSCPARHDSSGVQSQIQPNQDQDVETQWPAARASGRDGRAGVVKIKNSRRPDSANVEGTSTELNAVQRTVPGQSPTKSCYNAIVPHQDWVQDQMKSVEDRIWHAAAAYFQEKCLDAMAVPKFVNEPEPLLVALYQQVFGMRWQNRIFEIQDSGAQLKQIYVTQALFGAAIHKAVFTQDSRWDLRLPVDAGLDACRKYFDAALDQLGYGLEQFLNDVACRQAADPGYQKTAVVERARQLAGSTAMTLQPHLQQLSRLTETDERLNYKQWNLYLEEAFSAAITLKQITMSSDLGPFEIRWPRCGEHFDPEAHRKAYELGGLSADGNTVKVLHGILPGVWKQTDNDMLAYCEALVVPVASKEVGQ